MGVSGHTCSTPEGVIVGFTRAGRVRRARDRRCSTPEGVIVGFTVLGVERSHGASSAQRPRASSSGSPSGRTRGSMTNCCSTPEGVIVGFTRLRGPLAGVTPLLNARGRHRRVHRSPRGRWRLIRGRSTPEVSVRMSFQSAPGAEAGGNARAPWRAARPSVFQSAPGAEAGGNRPHRSAGSWPACFNQPPALRPGETRDDLDDGPAHRGVSISPRR